jgi:hypothetical protein
MALLDAIFLRIKIIYFDSKKYIKGTLPNIRSIYRIFSRMTSVTKVKVILKTL